MKHIDTWGQIDTLRYANQISKIKRHKERLDYIKDVPKEYHQLIYLLAMQMRLPQTISELPTREERKKAWVDQRVKILWSVKHKKIILEVMFRET